MKLLNKIFILTNLFLIKINLSFAWNAIKEWLKESIIFENWEDVLITDTDDWLNMLDSLLNYIQDSLSSLIYIIALWVFIYIWINLVIARWNPEEFKKHMMHFVYAAIWLFVVTAAWAMVKLVASLNI